MYSSNVEAPQPSSQEQSIYDILLQLITEQQEYNQQMMPDIMHQLHYKKAVTTPAGEADYTEEQKKIIDQRESTQKQIDEFNHQLQQGPLSQNHLNQLNRLKQDLIDLDNQINTFEKTATEEEYTWERMTDEEWYDDPNTTDTERDQWDIYQSTLERQKKALAGELPLTQQMIDQKQQEFDQLKTTFNIEGDTPDTAKANDTIAVQNLNEFKKRWQITEEAQRYGELTSGAQNLLQVSGLTTDLAQNKIGQLYGAGDQSNLMQQYQSLLQPYQAYNMAQYQSDIYNQQSKQNMYGSWMNLGGMLGGSIIGGLMLHSSRKVKKNIKLKTRKDEDRALKELLDTKSYEYQYKKGMGFGDGKHLGSIAEESPDSITNKDKTMINLGSKLELMGMGIKALARKLEVV